MRHAREATLSGVTLTTTVTYSGTIVSFVVPVTGTYSITAFGAEGGGNETAGGGFLPGGLGGEVSGTFALVQGETLEIAVGGNGGSTGLPPGNSNMFGTGNAGGGGGSFVVLVDGTTQTLLEAAGGGGGNAGGGAGGASVGGSGLGGEGYIGGGGGAGFYGNGGNQIFDIYDEAGAVNDVYATGGSDYANGLAGGSGEFYAHMFYTSQGASGGFGGGGGGAAFGGAGGGGGYTGGNTGEGGSSYIDSSAISSQLTAGVATAGEVLIDYPACFLAGTRLSTPRGEVAVEALREGDSVSVIEGNALVARPVRWIGRRRIDVAAQPQPALVLPIRIRRDAFADGIPRRDLLVSPDHAVFTDGVLIPARQLVNHATILQQTGLATVEYFHVELDRHALLLSEGLATESYLDTGNRALFANAGLATLLHPEFTVNAGLRCWRTDACAKLAVNEAEVAPVWQRLAARAAALGHPAPLPAVTMEPDLRLMVGGRTVAPILSEASRAVFALPPGAREVRLQSRAAAPSALRPWVEDRRRLGVAVAQLLVGVGAELLAVSPDDPALASGWWPPERKATRVWRWTDGDARLTLPPGATLLEVRLAGMTSYPVADAPSTQAWARTAASPRPSRRARRTSTVFNT